MGARDKEFGKSKNGQYQKMRANRTGNIQWDQHANFRWINTAGGAVGHSRFPEDHSHVCVRADLREEEEGLLQLFLSFTFLVVARQHSILFLVIKETIKKVLILKAELMVNCRQKKALLKYSM